MGYQPLGKQGKNKTKHHEMFKLGIAVHTLAAALGRTELYKCEFQANLGYITQLCVKNKTNKKEKEGSRVEKSLSPPPSLLFKT